MVANIKGKFLLKYYRFSFFRNMQSLKKKQLTVKEYTKELYKMNIRSRHVEDNLKRVSIYINGIRYEIQDMNLMSPSYVGKAYQFALKVEEKLPKKSQAKIKGSFKGEGSRRGQVKDAKTRISSKSEQIRKGIKDKRRRPYTKGLVGGISFQLNFFKCNQIGHKSY